VRDYAQVRAGGKITSAVAAEALKRLDVDEFGLDDMDARILKAIMRCSRAGRSRADRRRPRSAKIRGRSRRLRAVLDAAGVSRGATPRGRVATPRRTGHFGFVPPKSAEQASIFEGNRLSDFDTIFPRADRAASAPRSLGEPVARARSRGRRHPPSPFSRSSIADPAGDLLVIKTRRASFRRDCTERVKAGRTRAPARA